jgi:archaellum component FlaF (FlaF/FlaG flagellin family)
MSAANAAARKRRAPIEAPQRAGPTNTFQSAQDQQSRPAGLTLPQVISVIDARLINLETYVKDAKAAKPSSEVSNKNASSSVFSITENDVFMQELEGRFEVLVEEINNLKDMLLKLQSYTMDVNKTLLEERIHILSDLGQTGTENGEILIEDTK